LALSPWSAANCAVAFACIGLRPLLGQSTWDRYKPGSLAAIIVRERDGVLTQFKEAPGHHTVISAEAYPTRAEVQFLGSSRATSPERLKVLEMWAKSLGIQVDARKLFATELLFREDTLTLWLPVQAVLLPHFRRELTRGDRATLLVGWVGADGELTSIDWLFVVNEFRKE